MLFKISNSNFYTQKVSYFVFKDSSYPVKAISFKLHSHQTPDQPPLIPDQFLWLGRVWSGKKLPALIEERIDPQWTPLYPRCMPDAPTLKSRSSRPKPVLPSDQSPLCTTNPRPIPDSTTLTTLNIGPTPDLISTPGLKWIIQAM